MPTRARAQEDIAPEHNFRSREHAAAARRSKIDITASMVAMGRRLLVTRNSLPPDAWRRWLWENFGWRPSQARPYIRAARRFNRPGAECIDADALFLLAVGDASPRVVRAAADAARRGQPVTAEAAEQLLAGKRVAG